MNLWWSRIEMKDDQFQRLYEVQEWYEEWWQGLDTNVIQIWDKITGIHVTRKIN